MVSINGAMRHIFSLLPDIAASDATVLVTGESGTGKELVARAIHRLSDRKDMPFVTVNCGALPDQLIESELFGHVAGAFTDARRDREGRIAKAEGGTLFLDEIGELSPPVQVKLLRFIQERTYEPLGSNRVRQASVRIIAATNSDLNLEVEQGRFRRDFYYRLNVMNIHIPPLRHRREDIPLLMEHFLARQNLVQKKKIAGFSDRVLDVLLDYDFPGNIRELENIVEHAVILCRSSYIEMEHLPAYFRNFGREEVFSLSLEELEKHHIKKVLAKNGYNRNKTASELGINPSTLWRKMKKFNLGEND
jgi:transcriptional regulator with PAS, ATPase and Fis domain